MEVTEIRVRPVENGGSLLGTASITLEEAFAVHDVRIVDGRNGRFISFPSRQLPSGRYTDIAHPITAEFRQQLQDQVLATFDALEAEASKKDTGKDA